MKIGAQEAVDAVRQAIAIVDRHAVGHALTAVQDEACGATLAQERQDALAQPPQDVYRYVRMLCCYTYTIAQLHTMHMCMLYI